MYRRCGFETEIKPSFVENLTFAEMRESLLF